MVDVSLDVDTTFLQNVANSLQTSIIEEAQLDDIYQFRRDIANYARSTRKKLTDYLDTLNADQQKIYDDFYNEMNQIIDIKDTGIDFKDTITQHIVLDPVLMAYFAPGEINEYENNPVRLAFERFLDGIGFERVQNYQMAQLVNFVTRMVEGVKNPRKLQDILNSIYEVYFRSDNADDVDSALKATVKPTPSPIVDYMVSGVDEILQKNFGTNLKSQEVGILEPFVGTGTFLVHTMMYLREKLHATDEEIIYKFKNQLFGQELLLIAYYIAASNTQVELRALTNQEASFDNLVMGNTFMSLDPEKFTAMNFGYLDMNVKKLAKQYEAPIKVIVGNPPYEKQAMAPYKDIQNQTNEFYRDEEVSKLANLRNANSLSNTYIGALTYAIKRLENTNQNVISYIFPNDWLTSSTTIGIRKFVLTHFKDVYIVNLKGSNYIKDDDTQGQSVFDIQQGVAMLFLVTDKSYTGQANIHYHALDSMTKEEKFNWLRDHTIKNTDFTLIHPDNKYNYFYRFNQYEDLYDNKYQELMGCDISKNNKGLGLVTNRDTWVINSNRQTLLNSIQKQINYYNNNIVDGTFKDNKKQSTSFKYTRQNKPLAIHDNNMNSSIRIFSYRPFVKKWLYAPNPSQKISNQMIETYRNIFRNWHDGDITIANSNGKIDVLALDNINDYNLFKQTKVINISGDNDSYSSEIDLFNALNTKPDKIDNKAAMMYAIAHTPQYRDNFNDVVQGYYKYPVITDKHVSKHLESIGNRLMKLHLNYDQPAAPRFSDEHVSFYNENMVYSDAYYHIDKIKFDNKNNKIIFNDNIVINDVPQEALDYQLNGKAAFKYIMQCYQYNTNASTAKSIQSEVVDDPNLIDVSEYWHGGRYVFEILMRVIQLSVETMHIMDELRQLQDETDFLMLKDQSK